MPMIAIMLITLLATATYMFPWTIIITPFLVLALIKLFKISHSYIPQDYMIKYKKPLFRFGLFTWLSSVKALFASIAIGTFIGLISMYSGLEPNKYLIASIIFIVFQSWLFYSIFKSGKNEFLNIIAEGKGKKIFTISAIIFTALWALWQIYFQIIIKENWVIYLLDIRV